MNALASAQDPAPGALELARQRLHEYRQAESRILQSQEYTIGQGGSARRNRRADLEQVRAAIKDVQAEIECLTAAQAGRRIKYLRPL